MKSRNLFVGILVLFTGVVALLSVLGVFEFHWSILWKLWPMFLIIIGISILPLNDYVKGAILLCALAAGCLLYRAESKKYEGNVFTRFFNNHFTTWNWDWDDDKDNDEDLEEEDVYAIDQHFSEPFAEIANASIDIDFGAGDLILKSPCAELAKIDANSNFVKYSFRTEYDDEKALVFVSGKGHTKKVNKKNNNDVDIALCAQPVWNFKLDMGAADAELDFTPYKMENIEINGGACDLDLTLGDHGCNTTVDISTGASDIDIKVPSTMDCQINLQSAITGKDFTGFEKIGKGLWQTPRFGEGANRIVINMNCAVSDISVERY